MSISASVELRTILVVWFDPVFSRTAVFRLSFRYKCSCRDNLACYTIRGQATLKNRFSLSYNNSLFFNDSCFDVCVAGFSEKYNSERHSELEQAFVEHKMLWRNLNKRSATPVFYSYSTRNCKLDVHPRSNFSYIFSTKQLTESSRLKWNP